MNLHDVMLDDVDRVFLNLDEFACDHCINGQMVSCIVDDNESMARTKSAGDFANVSGLGILQCDRVVYCHAAAFVPQPLPGQKIEMDGHYWLVVEDGLSEVEGLLTLPLNRMY